MMVSSHATGLQMPEEAHLQAKKFVEERSKLLILPHANVDPDGLSCALACYQFFTALGKECTVVCPDTPPELLAFLPGFKELSQEFPSTQDYIITLDLGGGMEIDKLRYAVEEKRVNIIVTPKSGEISAKHLSFAEGGFLYDGTIVVDSAELKLLGSLFMEKQNFFRKVPILNIDHHISNTRFGQVQLIDTSAASATEVLYDWFTSNPEWKARLTSDIATLLLTGLITDTRSFQNPNTTPRSLEVGAELLDFGARQQEIIRCIYKTKPLSTLKIWGRALNHLQVNAAERIVWSLISREDLDEMRAESKETHGIIDELLTTIPDADVYVLFTETEDGGFKASMRTSENIDASALCGKLYGGGGHACAAGFKLKGYENFQLAVLESVQKIVGEMRGEQASGPPLTSTSGGETKGIKEIKETKDGEIDVVKRLAM